LNNKPIGIFDSGVGGLTVVREIIRYLPEEKIVYFGDTARVPYGPRNLNEVRGFVFEIAEFLRALDVKLIVIACNTGTAAGLKDAQEYFDIPIVGVIEPGARGAIQATISRKIGVIATQGTINSNEYIKAIHAFDAGVEVHAQACPMLVDFAEQGETRGKRVKQVIKWYLDPLTAAGIDTLILGCTHYPLLASAISNVVTSRIELISSARETAIEVKELLSRRKHRRKKGPRPAHRFLATGDVDQFMKLGQRFLGRRIKQVEKVNLRELNNYGSLIGSCVEGGDESA
jgi:glutamate racemase